MAASKDARVDDLKAAIRREQAEKGEYQPISQYHEVFLKKAWKRKEFRKSQDGLEEKCQFAREIFTDRSRTGLTQEDVAGLMGTTKSAVSLEDSLFLNPF